MNLVQRAIEEEHHLVELAREGDSAATPAILVGEVVAFLSVVLVLVLGVSLVAYYWIG
jgi:hypothetical protein